MKLKYPLIATALGLIVTTSVYNPPVGEIQAVEDINNPEYVAEHYDPENIGTLEERIELYNYLTSDEYSASTFDKITNEDNSVKYVAKEGVPQYIMYSDELGNYIEYTDTENNLVRLHQDGVVTLAVGEKYNKYYVDQMKDYIPALNQANQLCNENYEFDFRYYTPKEAQEIVNTNKSMTVEEFKEHLIFQITNG
ncbi:MAG: hypothetical protein ACI4WH_02410 [Oscillospiraceae bacterium]